MELTRKLRRMTRKTEFYLFIVLVLMCIAIQIISGGQLFEPNTIVDIARSLTIFRHVFTHKPGRGYFRRRPLLPDAGVADLFRFNKHLPFDGMVPKRRGWHSCWPL